MVTHIAPSATGWTDRERLEIDRLQTLCDGRQEWELDSGHTDAGDPWCIIYDRLNQLVVVHLARIDRRYVVVWPQEGRSDSKATVTGAVNICLGYAPAA
jgi:hypothetical protein